MVLEQQLGLVRVLEVYPEHVEGVNCYQDAVEPLREGWLIHTVAETTVDFKVTGQLLWHGSLPISAPVAEHRLHDQVLLKDLIEALLHESDFEIVEALQKVAHLVIDDDHF